MKNPLYCRTCGSLLPLQSLFCSTCGTSQVEYDSTPTHVHQQEAALSGTGRLPPGRLLQKRYRLLHTVGQGGMGAVYVAQDTQLGNRLVAVKEMSMSRLTSQELAQAVEQFRREAHLLASLHHPHLPSIHEYFREEDRWYLVMSFIEGQNLQTILNTTPDKKLPVNKVVRIGIELCEVLDYLHTHEPQVIFRDLKPLNVMLTPKGHICLIDFGIARHFKQEQTKDTAYYYSVGYAPPEQYGQSQTDPRSDIYSLGATLHQLLSGLNPARMPFQFPNLHLVDPSIPVPLANMIAQMLEMNAEARPTSVAEVKAQLERVLTTGHVAPTIQVVSPEHIVPTIPIVTKQKAELRVQRFTPAPPTRTVVIVNGLWHQANDFFHKRRVIAWICFIVLSLAIGEVWPRLTIISRVLDTSNYINFWEGYFTISSLPFYGASIVAAGVGLAFLLSKKRRAFIDISGGIALTLLVFGEAVVYSPLFDNIAYIHFLYPTSAWYTANSMHPSLFFVAFPIFFMFFLWLFVGTYFFLRSANCAAGVLFGISLIVWGMQTWILQKDYDVIILLLVLSLESIVLGFVTLAVALAVALGKKERTKQNS